MGTTAVKTQTENRAHIAALTQASAPVIPNWKLWGNRLSFSLVGPGAAMSAGLLINLLLARWLPPQQYGSFVLVFAVFLFTPAFTMRCFSSP